MRKYTISVGGSRKATSWPRNEITWDELLTKLSVPVRGDETQQEYFHMKKSEQDERKDVGGFVGGTFTGDRRKASLVEGRDIITLDMDAIPAHGAQSVIDKVGLMGCAAAIYSTRKHTPSRPRLRVLIPASRTMTPDEYEPAARKIAELVGIGLCDPTTFEASRLMYWPSCSSDAEYVFEAFKGAECNVDSILGMYGNWRDVSQWPVVPGESAAVQRAKNKQEDPESKAGVVGAFCKAYDIYAAMDKFIPGTYDQTADEDRYTYIGGSTSGGAIVYEHGKFLFSHHATDPCSGMLVNAFDLVRMHKFFDLDLDVKEDTRVTSMPSYKAMAELALTDKRVQGILGHEREAKIIEAFGEAAETGEALTSGDEYDPEWQSRLEMDSKGKMVLGTMENICLIIRYDQNFRGRIWLDEFSGRIMVNGPIIWDPAKGSRLWTDNDDTGLYWYIERFYTKLAGINKVSSAVSFEASNNRRNPVKEYLQGVKWDGVPRTEKLLSKYLGATDSLYVREVTKKTLVAAVARVMQPGTKFDNMLILVGPQGLGKSTLFRKLGMQWFTDSLTSFDGKDASELIQGVWIVEVGELTAMNRQESNAVKQFLSKQDDMYRAAYGRRTGRHARTCVFVGTSNDAEFLKDTTGNRRFWPVEVGETEMDASVFSDLTQDVIDQIWAEAVMRYRIGESLYLSQEVEELAREKQKEHQIQNGKEGIVEEFLNMKIPANWYDMSDMERKQFINGNLKIPEKDLVERRRACPMEIWVYCFGKQAGNMQRFDSIEINQIMHNISGWRTHNPIKYGNLGNQRGYYRSL